MFTIEKPSENRINIELSGSLDADTMASALDDLLAKSRDITNGKMRYRITEFALPSFGALGVEFSRMPQLFGLLGKFDKCAVMSDAAWLRTAAEIEGALFPGIRINSFGLDDVDAAEAWLNAEGSVNV